ncbi:MAG: permease-like cell division protein FtsX [Thiohalophilus sp.]|uniref:permease-like cell division protein FtsX n=1 Tax=Thiohalophilus sp. TaxID=3028392 RepID=UPI0028709041|nr:permease-like cell division protein FtsX [Thiohalophilus sp.]MDR9435492.1 permease-like cell division protein FtsX [Thiohalophilus sp.]
MRRDRPAQSSQPRRSESRRTGPPGRLRIHLLRHAQVFFYTLGQLSRRPTSMLMTAAVIGIALALPAGLHVVLKSAQQLSGGWDETRQISLFLQRGTPEDEARRLVRQLENHPRVRQVSYISPEQALAEFQRLSGFGEALDALQENPLPAVLVVLPALERGNPAATESLLAELRENPRVDLARLDVQWVKRLYAIMDILRQGVYVLASLLALAVLLVVGNTIRLAIQNRRDEIVIVKLIGGTDAFIRRPFLYTGFWYGLFGALIAWLLVTVSLWILSGPVEKLAGLYQNSFSLSGLNIQTTAILLVSGIALGLVGSWIAVGRHLRDIEPG